MGNAAIYYYPTLSTFATSSGSMLEKIDFGEGLSDLQLAPIRRVSDTVSLTGRTSRTSWAPGLRVRVLLERFTDDALAKQLFSFQSHADRGLFFGVTADTAKVVAHNQRGEGFFRNQTTMSCAGNIFSAWESAATLVANDPIHVSSPAPSHPQEEHKVSSYSSTSESASVISSTQLIYDHGAPAIVRYRDFFPMCFLPESEVGKPLLTHDHRIAWTFDMVCTLYPWWSVIFASPGSPVVDDPTNPQDPDGLGTSGIPSVRVEADTSGAIVGDFDPDGPIVEGWDPKLVDDPDSPFSGGKLPWE